MSSSEKIEMDGVVVDSSRGATFKVKLDENGMELDCTIAGKLRMNSIRILPGDKVTVAISPYDLTKGIITWRHK